MVVADNEPGAVEIDRLPHGVVVVEAGAVDGDLDAAGLVLDGEVLVTVAALIGAHHHGLDDELLVVAADFYGACGALYRVDVTVVA